MQRISANQIPLWRIHALMLVSSILVSTSFTVGKSIADGMDPAILTLIRFFAAVVCFLPYILRTHGFSIPSISALLKYSMVSASLVVFFWCMFESLRYTSALNTSALFTLVPGIAGIYGAILIKERLGWQRIAALCCGMIGALWVIFQGRMEKLLALDCNKGDLIFLAGCFAMGLYTPLVKKLHRGEPMGLMTFWVLTTGVGWLALLSIGKIADFHWQQVETTVWAGILYLAIFCTIITFFLTQYAILFIGSTRVMAYSYFYPGLVLVLDWLLGKGLPPLTTLPGVMIVLVATIILQKSSTP